MEHLFKVFDGVFNKEAPNYDQVLKELRINGAKQIDCLKIFMVRLNLSIPEADKLVMYSEVWNDFKETNDLIRNKLSKSLDNNIGN